MYYKTYKFRLYPNSTQRSLINKTFGNYRFIYNYFLSKIRFEYKTANENYNYYHEYLTKKYSFLNEIDNYTVKKILSNLDKNYKLLKYCKENLKFKDKYHKNSYFISNCNSNNNSVNYIKLDLKNRKVTIPKLNEIKIRGYKKLLNINGKILSYTISRESNDKYYISILFMINEHASKVKLKMIVGIDLGIKNLLTLSDGKVYENCKYISKYEKRIKTIQLKLSKKVKGSNNYYKYKNKLAILYSKLVNARKHYIHKITTEITDKYDIISCENLHVKNMIMNGKKSNLSKSINDACFNEILRQLKYKSELKGKYFFQIDDYYASSQICSRCDNQDKKYKNLNERNYKCRKCNLEIDRDLNASINIMFEGVKMYIKKYC